MSMHLLKRATLLRSSEIIMDPSSFLWIVRDSLRYSTFSKTHIQASNTFAELFVIAGYMNCWDVACGYIEFKVQLASRRFTGFSNTSLREWYVSYTHSLKGRHMFYNKGLWLVRWSSLVAIKILCHSIDRALHIKNWNQFCKRAMKQGVRRGCDAEGLN